MKTLVFSLIATLLSAPILSSQEVDDGDRILAAYNFDFEFFTKVEREWRRANGYTRDQLVRINPRGLIQAGGLEIETGETFIHQNIGSKSIIFFSASSDRQKQLKSIYERFMGKQLLQLSEEQLKSLREGGRDKEAANKSR